MRTVSPHSLAEIDVVLRKWGHATTSENEARQDDLRWVIARAMAELATYRSTRDGLAVWRAFSTCRRHDVPVQELILRKFDTWAARLQSKARGGDHAVVALELATPRPGRATSRAEVNRAGRRLRAAAEVQRLVDLAGEKPDMRSIYATVARTLQKSKRTVREIYRSEIAAKLTRDP